MRRRPPRSTRTDTLFPYTTLFRSVGVPIHITKGDRPRTVYPPLRLLDHTDWYVGEDRARIVRRVRRSDRGYRAPPNLLLNEHGRAMTRKLLTAQLAEAFAAARLLGTLHCLRPTFTMAMLARLQIQARTNSDQIGRAHV